MNKNLEHRVQERKAELKDKITFFGEKLIDDLMFFEKEIYHPTDVLYPCCADDIAPSIAFLDSNITQLDKDSELSEFMKECNVKFVVNDIYNYKPKKKSDLVLILHPGSIPPNVLTKNLDNSGYVIADDYHGQASQLMKNSNFTYKGLIKKGSDDNLFLSKNDKSGLNKFGYLHVFKKNDKTNSRSRSE